MFVNLYIGVDTSNYTTSIAVVDNCGTIIWDGRMLLTVKDKAVGLRQQEALFQHIHNLPDLWHQCTTFLRASGYNLREVKAVGASTRPRNQEGSYMPVFLAGQGFCRNLSSTLDIPFIETDHQSGHFRCMYGGNVRDGQDIKDRDSQYINGFHLSGGTCELIEIPVSMLLSMEENNGPKIIGGSKDISFGQLLDRTGVLLGLQFPCGKKMDQLALEALNEEYVEQQGVIKIKKLNKDNLLPKIKVNEGYFNLSGIETAVKLQMEGLDAKTVALWLMARIGEAIGEACSFATGSVYLMGGVSSSKFLRTWLKGQDNVIFGDEKLGSDNGVGIALITKEQFELQFN